MSDPCRKGPYFHGEFVCFHLALLVGSSILTSVQASAASPPSSSIVVVLTLRLPRSTTYTRFHPRPLFFSQCICYHPIIHPDLGPPRNPPATFEEGPRIAPCSCYSHLSFMTWFCRCWSACMLLIFTLRCSITVFYQSRPTSCCLSCSHERYIFSRCSFPRFSLFTTVQCMSYIYHSFSPL
jgi:hypothetical protein